MNIPKQLSHAYIVTGGGEESRRDYARSLAQAYVCPHGPPACGVCRDCVKALSGNHPDITQITLEENREKKEKKREITVDQARTLRSDAYIRPNEAGRKVYLIDPADALSPAAQNVLLKVVEEGPPYAAFLLLGENSGGLLRTVRSRCEELALIPAEAPESGETVQERRELVVKLADALECAGELELLEAAMALDGKRGREDLSALLDELVSELAGRAAAGGDRRRLLRAAELVKTLREAAKLNVNGGQLAGWLCAGMFEAL